MVYSKIKKISFILLCCIVIVFPFWCVRGLCSDDEWEEVSYDTVSGITIDASRNYFASGSNAVGYVQLEKGYKYKFTNNTTSNYRRLVFSSELPAINGTYEFIILLNPGESYEFISDYTGYMYFDWWASSSVDKVYRSRLMGQNTAIADLVENVGPNSLWGIFENAVQYIWVVVIAAFGFFIIRIIVKKLSKGKGGM